MFYAIYNAYGTRTYSAGDELYRFASKAAPLARFMGGTYTLTVAE